MKIEYIDPRKITFDRAPVVDDEVRESIREHGLYDTGKETCDIRDLIAVRREGNGFRLVRGADELQAVLDLIEKDADCYDVASGHWIKASELYETIRAGILFKEPHNE